MIRQLTSDEWKFWWTVIFIIQGTVALLSAIWFSIGGIFDVTYLFKKLMHNKIDEQDDGTVHKTTNQQD
jgi:hypothetical protein